MDVRSIIIYLSRNPVAENGDQQVTANSSQLITQRRESCVRCYWLLVLYQSVTQPAKTKIHTTRAVPQILPASIPNFLGSILMIETPVSCPPSSLQFMRERWMGAAPRYAGSKLGCTFRAPSTGNLERILSDKIRPKEAVTRMVWGLSALGWKGSSCRSEVSQSTSRALGVILGPTDSV